MPHCPNPNCDASYSVDELESGHVSTCDRCGIRLPTAHRARASTLPSSETEPDSLASPRVATAADLSGPFGRYDILGLLGRGGMGAVYLAQDSKLPRQVALKVPHRRVIRDPEVRERFLREAHAAAALNHPNLCPIFDIGEVDGLPYITMPYIEGGTLASKIKRGRPWDQREAAEVVRQLADAMVELHRRGIVHRDLKPANVMINARGGLVIMDFGLARRFEGADPAISVFGAPLGTLEYMPPEQAAGDSNAIGPRSDVYSLGVILYELATGRRPFEGPILVILGMIAVVDPKPPSILRPDLDPRLEEICLKAMAKKPEGRHASMEELASALAGFLADGTPSTPSSPPGGPFTPVLGDDGTPDRPRPTIQIGKIVATLLRSISGLVRPTRDSGRSLIKVNDPGSDVPATPTPPRIAPGSGKADPPPEKPQARVEPPKVAEDAVVTNSLGIKLRLIPAGEFDMGSDATDPDARDDEMAEGRKHRVRITRPFYLGESEVTVGQFRKFAERSGYRTDAERDGLGGWGWNRARVSIERDPKYHWRSPGFSQDDDHPVVMVSHNDALAFCRWLSQEEGRAYRLPTEAEWEYACRAGRASRYWSGDDAEGLAAVANLADGSMRERYPGLSAIRSRDGFVHTAPVGRFRANGFGLFNMHGNVWEWCADWYDVGYYARSPEADPPGPAQGSDRVFRGGSWISAPEYCRAAYREWHTPGYKSHDLGFRLARNR